MSESVRPPAPPGFVWIYHRLTTDAEYMVGAGPQGIGMPMPFKAGEYRLVNQKLGEWLCEHTRRREDPNALEDPDPIVRLNAVQYAFAMDGDPFFGTPLDLTGQVEYLQLGASDMYLHRSTDGVKTTRKLIPVKGMEPVASAEPSAAGPSDADLLRARIAELEAIVRRQAPSIRPRKRPRSRLVPKAPTPEPSAEAPA